MSFVPHHRIVAAPGASPTRTVLFLHGIFGSGRNWRTFAADWTVAHPDWRAVLVDLRGHGRSRGAQPPHDLQACAADLTALAATLGRPPEAVVGHSFGGKVALVHARGRPPGLRALWLLDSPPGPAPSAAAARDSEAGRVLATLRAIPLPVRQRTDVVTALEQRGAPRPVAQWMATNLVPLAGGGFTWTFDLEALAALLDDYWQVDGRPFLEEPPAGLAVHVVQGGRSDRWGPDDRAWLATQSARGRFAVHVLPNAGHWVHVDDPAGLRGLLRLD